MSAKKAMVGDSSECPGVRALQPPPETSQGARAGFATVVACAGEGLLIEVDGTQRIARIATSQPVEHAPGAEVLLNWVGDTPVVVGLLRLPGANTTGDTVEIDADKVMLHAKRELVLRCGKGWIRLTRDGRIVIDGVDLVSRAKRSNRVRGGSINLN